MLKLENISKFYKKKCIFEQMNFQAGQGQITVIIGESGIGKSTLLEMIAGLKTIQSGSYLFAGKKLDYTNDDEMSRFRNQNIGYIPQDFALIEDYTVKDNLILPIFYSDSVSHEEAERRIEPLLTRFSLQEIVDNKVRDISGGQKQRVAIIRSVVLSPQLILADEPTASLDRDNFQNVFQFFQEQKRDGRVIIISTHDDRLLKIADKVYKVQDFQLLEVFH